MSESELLDRFYVLLCAAGDQIAESDDTDLLTPIAAAIAAYWDFRANAA